MKLTIRYNAPVTLTFAILAAIVLLLDQILQTQLIPSFFTAVPRGYFEAANPVSYLRLFLHAAGHVSWEHLLGNFALILLLGPVLEEKYGSSSLFIMIFITALITGILNAVFFSTGLLGASGVVFMMIILVSFTNIKDGEIPITFFLVVLLYLAKEIISIFRTDDISQFAHIAGGICGSVFGFFKPRRKG